MATQRETTPQWTTTVIVSSSLQGHDTLKILTTQQHRIRCSDSVDSGVFIFPLSGTAFLLVDPQDLPEPLEESGLIEKIEKFVEIHRNCFLLLHTPFNREKELQALALIQKRFFSSNLRVLPVRNSTEMVKGMLTIAKVNSKPHVDRVREQMSLAKAHILENSPVWKMLRDTL